MSFICGVIALSCAGRYDNITHTYRDFPIEKSIELEEIEIGPILGFVGDMIVLEDILITLDLKSDTFFQAFDLNSFVSYGRFVNRGNGPNEEVQIVPNIDWHGSNSFLYRSIQDIKILKFNKEQNQLETEERIMLPLEYMDVFHLFQMKNKVIGYDIFNNGSKEYLLLHPTTGKIEPFGPRFPRVNSTINKDKYQTIFSRTILGQPDGEYFAALYDKFPFLRVYDAEGNLIRESRYDNNQLPPTSFNNDNLDLSELNRTTLNYLKLKTTKNYIYGLYSGKTHGELRTQERQVDDYGMEIHIWNWKGEPIARHILNKEIFSFSVSPDDRFLMASSVNHNDKLFRYYLCNSL